MGLATRRLVGLKQEEREEREEREEEEIWVPGPRTTGVMRNSSQEWQNQFLQNRTSKNHDSVPNDFVFKKLRGLRGSIEMERDYDWPIL